MKAVLTVELPADVETSLRAAGYGPERLARAARQSLATSLFSGGVLGLEVAARVAGMGLWDFIPFLGEQGIAVADCDEEESAKEVEAARWLSQKKTRSSR